MAVSFWLLAMRGCSALLVAALSGSLAHKVSVGKVSDDPLFCATVVGTCWAQAKSLRILLARSLQQRSCLESSSAVISTASCSLCILLYDRHVRSSSEPRSPLRSIFREELPMSKIQVNESQERTASVEKEASGVIPHFFPNKDLGTQQQATAVD